MIDSPKIGDRFEGVLLETIVESKSSRPRVKPLELFSEDFRVEFPRNLRDENPIGTRFRGDLKIAQKTSKKDGSKIGKPYLVVTNKSIEIITDYTPEKIIKAVKLNTVSDRAYKYIETEFNKIPELISFSEFRAKAYKNSKENPEKISESSSLRVKRSEIIKTYALTRAKGNCEGCENQAPFLKKNGEPYLEVHHMIELSKNGSDSPINVIALCPNCHSKITNGIDGNTYNEKLKIKIEKLEAELDK